MGVDADSAHRCWTGTRLPSRGAMKATLLRLRRVVSPQAKGERCERREIEARCLASALTLWLAVKRGGRFTTVRARWSLSRSRSSSHARSLPALQAQGAVPRMSPALRTGLRPVSPAPPPASLLLRLHHASSPILCLWSVCRVGSDHCCFARVDRGGTGGPPTGRASQGQRPDC